MAKRMWFLGGFVGILIAAMIGAWFFWLRDSGPIPKQYLGNLHFTVYYPSRLPAGYTVDQSSFKREGDVLIFSIKAPKGRNLAVSQQIAPVDAPTHQSQNKPFAIPGEKSFTTPAGATHVGLWSDKYVADITTADSWIIINATGFTVDEASAIAQAFREL